MNVVPIKLKDALDLMNRKDERGAPVSFGIAFHTSTRDLKKYRRVHLASAERCGLPTMISKANDEMIGIKPLVGSKKNLHHFAVDIHLITEFNNQPVVP